MRIVLIDPGYKTQHSFHPNVGLGYVAAVLQGWNDITILDMNFSSDEEFVRLMTSEVDLVGVTATSFTFHLAAAILDKVKSLNKKAKTVMGGPHTTIAMEEIFQHARVDYVVYGEGEQTITELVRLLETARDPSPEELAGIKGLMFRRDNEVIVNPPRPWITNLDEVPFPAFNPGDIERYPTYPLITSRGCPFQCIYCAAGLIWGRKWRARTPGNIIEEIKHARQHYGWKGKRFGVMDDSFNISVPRALEFCEQLLQEKLDIEWACQGIRADNVTPELARKMQMAGCQSVGVGVESADVTVLKNINKGETLEQIGAGIKKLADAGIAVSASFMIGNPGDSLESCKKSMEFIQDSPLLGCNFYLALPYPKTGLWDFVRENGRFLQPDYTKFQHTTEEPVFETPDFPAEERRQAYKLARRFVLKRSIMKIPRQGILYLRNMGLRKIGLKGLFRLGARFISREGKLALALLLGKGHPWEQ